MPLVRKMIIDALSMHDTVFTLNDEQKRRFMQPYRVDMRTAPSGAGRTTSTCSRARPGFRTTAGDMLIVGGGQPASRIASRRASARDGAALAAALVAAHEPHAKVGPRRADGPRLVHRPRRRAATLTAARPQARPREVSFNPREDTALVVLSNTGPGSAFSADILGEHIRARLAGTTPIALADMTIPAAGSVPRLLRFAAAWWLTMIAAGAFIFCLVMSIQGVALQLLPRRLFLRASSFLQIGAFAVDRQRVLPAAGRDARRG